MSDRMTSASVKGVSGIANRGRYTRAEMIAAFRRYYERQAAEAAKALAVADEDIIVETYLGLYAMKNRERVFD